jgi:small subunit ribosomal protein S16
MVSIKLRPVGKKKQITYRIVVLPKKSKLVGEYIDDLGWYNPHTNKFLVDAVKTKKWIANGAQPTDTVHNILIKAKIIEGTKIHLLKKSKQEPKPVEATAPAETPVETPAE